jgi:lysozyme
MSRARIVVAALSLTAAGFVGIMLHEDYSDTAIIPVPGDVLTIGFGTTEGVKLGDRTTPPQALERALRDVQKYEGALRSCITVPLHQHEYDAYLTLAYNIGPSAFCRSTLVRRLNAQDYAGACGEILRWRHFRGRDCGVPGSGCAGLWKRRQLEHALCRGAQ